MLFGHSPDETTAAVAAKITPPVAVSTMAIFGVHITDIAVLLTIAYTLLNTYLLIRDKVYRPWRGHGSNQ